MFNLSPSVKIFVCTKPVDMRRSFDGLFGLVQSLIGQDPFSGALFLFRSKSGNFIKVLWWDGDGWAIFAKRLEVGTFHFPDVRFVNGEYAPVEIERRRFAMLLEGIDTSSVKRLKRYRHDSRDQTEKAPQKMPKEIIKPGEHEPVLLS
ncbi:MAG: IS66 family insertion sequence element accessory protein TnpB [Candidatus Melainabacteria bacterium]|nr:IS66 family insertion sequence element accessory protein TnpB [Candidatus Melainabacteria bacterium]